MSSPVIPSAFPGVAVAVPISIRSIPPNVKLVANITGFHHVSKSEADVVYTLEVKSSVIREDAAETTENKEHSPKKETQVKTITKTLAQFQTMQAKLKQHLGDVVVPQLTLSAPLRSPSKYLSSPPDVSAELQKYLDQLLDTFSNSGVPQPLAEFLEITEEVEMEEDSMLAGFNISVEAPECTCPPTCPLRPDAEIQAKIKIESDKVSKWKAKQVLATADLADQTALQQLLEERLDHLKKHIRLKVQQIAGVLSVLQKVEAWRKSSGVRLHEEMAKILSDIDKLKTTKKALQKQLDTAKEKPSETASNISSLQKLNQKLTNDVAQATAKVKSLEVIYEKIMAQLKEHRIQKERLIFKLRDFKEVEEMLEDLDTPISVLEQRFGHDRSALAEVLQTKAATNDSLDRHTAKLLVKNQVKDDEITDLARMRVRQERAEEENEKAQQRIIELESSTKSLECSTANASEMKRLTDETYGREQYLAEFELSRAEQLLETISSEYQQLSERCNNLQAIKEAPQLDNSAQTEYEQLERAVAELQAKVDAQEKENSALSVKLQDFQKKMAFEATGSIKSYSSLSYRRLAQIEQPPEEEVNEEVIAFQNAAYQQQMTLQSMEVEKVNRDRRMTSKSKESTIKQLQEQINDLKRRHLKLDMIAGAAGISPESLKCEDFNDEARRLCFADDFLREINVVKEKYFFAIAVDIKMNTGSTVDVNGLYEKLLQSQKATGTPKSYKEWPKWISDHMY